MAVSTFVEVTAPSSSEVGAHVAVLTAVLRDAGLVTVSRRGRWIDYDLPATRWSEAALVQLAERTGERLDA